MKILDACQRLKEDYIKLGPMDTDALRKGIQAGNFKYIKHHLAKRQEFVYNYRYKVLVLLERCFSFGEDSEAVYSSVKVAPNGRIIIEGDLDVTNPAYRYFPSVIQRVEGKLNIGQNSIQRMDFLEEVGTLDASGSELKSLDRLTRAGDIQLQDSKIEHLPSLIRAGSFYCEDLRGDGVLQSLPKLAYAKDLYLGGNQITELPSLVEVENTCGLQRATKLRAADKLKKVGGSLYIGGTSLTALPSLEFVGSLHAEGLSDFSGLDNLKHVEKRIEIQGTAVDSLNCLEYVGGKFYAYDSPLSSLLNLREVGGIFNLNGTRVERLPSLKIANRGLFIVSRIPFQGAPQLQEIGECLEIGKTAKAGFRQLFPALKKIGKDSGGRSLLVGNKELMVEASRLNSQGELELAGTIGTNTELNNIY